MNRAQLTAERIAENRRAAAIERTAQAYEAMCIVAHDLDLKKLYGTYSYSSQYFAGKYVPQNLGPHEICEALVAEGFRAKACFHPNTPGWYIEVTISANSGKVNK